MSRLSTKRHPELTGLPLLSPGRHLDPTDGACVMEFVSQLSGEQWSDHPRCTHPALAELARLVNDARAPSTSLALLAPDLIGLAGRDSRIAATLVDLCVRTAMRTRTGHAAGHGEGTARRARRRMDRAAGTGLPARWTRLTDPLYRRGPAQRAMARSVDEIRFAAGPGALVDLLQAAIAECRRLLRPIATAQPDTQAVSRR